MDFGSGNYGCSHYRRRCKIRAPCCGEIFDCRHCHNEAKNSPDINHRDRHDVPRHLVEKVICSLCNTEQDVQQNCINCGVSMGKYHCATCKFFDDDITKNHFHCDECGICRIGGKHNYFHCKTCGGCYSNAMKGKHRCVERAMKNDCPVCFEFLFDSMEVITILSCGHPIHWKCLNEKEMHNGYSCLVCSESNCDISRSSSTIDEEAEHSLPAVGVLAKL